jgi:hypothetical protein
MIHNKGTWRSRSTILKAAAFATAAGLLATPVLAVHSWSTYHWKRTTTQISPPVGDNVTTTWDSYLTTAIADWNRSTVIQSSKVVGGTTRSTCAPRAGRIEVCNYTYGATGWLGIAQIWATRSHITQAVAKMNDSYFNTSTYNKAGWRNLVMCQEIGHTFGLAHVNENNNNSNTGSCMDYTSDPDGTRIDNKDPWGKETNQYPNQHDYDQLGIIYNALDSTTTVGSATAASKMPPAANQGYFNSRAEWGALKQRSADGEVEIYERDFGGGNKVHTRVIRVVEKTPTPDSTGGSHDHHDH